MTLKPGDPAPSFVATTHDGAAVRLEDYSGRYLVLYFYPRDSTPHCTAQACSLRDSQTELNALGAGVLGVSAQGESSHEKFVKKHRLNFPLLLDGDQRIAKAYNAAGSNWLSELFRQTFGVYRRVTYIIDPTGHIAHIIDDPNCHDHGAEVLRLIKASHRDIANEQR